MEGGARWTLEEVARHDDINDGWIVVGENVYDITNFALTHPGWNNSGQVSTTIAIARALGTDATSDFKQIHSQHAWKQLADFKIGTLAPTGEQGSGHPLPEHPTPAWLPPQTEFWKLSPDYKSPNEIVADMKRRDREEAERIAALAVPPKGGVKGGAGGGRERAGGGQLRLGTVTRGIGAVVAAVALGYRGTKRKA